VDDEIEVEDENETTFKVVEKYEENITMKLVEDINKDIVNVEVYLELTFLEEWLANPKYESEYGKFSIIAEEEEPNKEETIEVVEGIAAMEEEMKENKDVFLSYRG
jgi:hypothetical protein